VAAAPPRDPRRRFVPGVFRTPPLVIRDLDANWIPLQVVYIYELLCRGEDPSSESPEFWNEFFLLQPNFEALENEIGKLNNEQLQLVKPNLNTLFQRCIEMLDTGRPVTPLSIYRMSSMFFDSPRRSSQAPVQQPANAVLPVLWNLQKVQL